MKRKKTAAITGPSEPDDDPRPVPPVRPDNDECCASGCDPCIFDLYDDAMLRYQAELRAWEERHRST
jgi:hypothetical protein